MKKGSFLATALFMLALQVHATYHSRVLDSKTVS